MMSEVLLADEVARLNVSVRELIERINYMIGTTKKGQAVLSSHKICEELGISRDAFYRRRESLMEYGLFKDGQWKMRKLDLEQYKQDRMGL